MLRLMVVITMLFSLGTACVPTPLPPIPVEPVSRPVRFLDVRGNWETLSAEGLQPGYFARGAWMGSMIIPLLCRR